MRINTINTYNNNRLNFKGIESAYAYQLPDQNPLEYECGIALRLNDEGNKDLSNYKKLLKKYRKLNEVMSYKKSKTDFSDLDKITDNIMLLGAVKTLKTGPRYDYYVERGTINNQKLKDFDFTVGDGKKKNAFNNPKNEELQRSFYTDLIKFVENINSSLLNNWEVLNNNGIEDVRRAIPAEVKDFCAPKLKYFDIDRIARVVIRTLNKSAQSVLKQGRYVELIK